MDQQLKQILFKKAIVIVQILYVVDHEKAQLSCKMLFREKMIFLLKEMQDKKLNKTCSFFRLQQIYSCFQKYFSNPKKYRICICISPKRFVVKPRTRLHSSLFLCLLRFQLQFRRPASPHTVILIFHPARQIYFHFGKYMYVIFC